MTQEEKDLLLKDLCARLPYGVKSSCTEFSTDKVLNIEGIYVCDKDVPMVRLKSEGIINVPLMYVKPYLFPFSNMTDEQEEEYNKLNFYEGWFPRTEEALDYLIANHFDYRGLIHMGLALDTTGLNIY